MTSDKLAVLRMGVLGLTGAVCFLYAVLALALGRPDPMAWWIPGLFGAISGVLIFVGARVAGPRHAGMAFDEGYHADNHRAQRIAYWVALMLYPVFGIFLAFGLVAPAVAFATMGTITGGSYLVLFAWFDHRRG